MVCDISAESVTNVIREMFLEAYTVLPEDMRALIRRSAAEERSPLGRSGCLIRASDRDRRTA